MPVVLRIGPYKFFFYSNEGIPRKAPHVHVRGSGGEAKLALIAPFAVLDNIGLSAKELREIQKLVEQYQDVLTGAYHEYFA